MATTDFQPTTTFTFEAIGTAWVIEIAQPLLRAPEQAEWLSTILALIDGFDRTFSRFRPDSLVSTMAKQAGRHQLPEYSQPLIDAYYQLYQDTQAQFSPLIGQTISDAGYDAQYTLTPNNPQPAPAWADILDYQHPYLHLARPALLDFGAAGKGYLVDLVGQTVRDLGATHFSINAGGDILHYHHQSNHILPIALEHPLDNQQAIGIAHISNHSICASAGNRRRWDKYTHIINPLTAESPDHILATWVIADTALQADALATALFFAQPQQLSMDSHHYAIVYADHSLQTSPHFPAHFF